jgi:DNA-binding MarR family transcriptional regulator
MGELAQRLVCDASNVTGLVDRLETRGLIERRPGPDDRRVRMLVLTPAGEELRERALARFTEAPAGIAALSAEEQRTLRDLLRKALDTS